MIKQITSFFLFTAATFGNALPQTNDLLQKALEKYSKINSFKCKCIYQINAPIDLSYSCTMMATRNTTEPICGFNYYFKYDSQEFISDFHIFNGSAYFMSYKGKITMKTKIENPDAFVDKDYESETLGKGKIPSVVKSPVMFYWTLFRIENEIKTDLNDTTLEFSQMADTLLDETKCHHFKFSKNDLVKNIYIDSYTLLPKFYKVSSKNSFFDQSQSALFQNFDVSSPIPISFYAEDNLLPSNWKESIYVPQEINMIGKNAPEWTLPELKNDSVLSLGNLKGKIVLLEFTATWCAHCIEAAVMMNKLASKFKDNENVVLLSIFSSSADNKDKILKFSEKHKIMNRVLINAKDIGDNYHVEGYPAFFVLDNTRMIINQIRGYSDENENIIFEEINQLVKQ